MKLGRNLRYITVMSLLAIVPPTAISAAEVHVVPLTELHQRAALATRERQQNLAEIDRFLSADSVTRVLRTAKIDVEHLRNVIPLLSDQELARLSIKSRQAQSNFAAGALSNQDLTYIVIALATAVLILVIVAAR